MEIKNKKKWNRDMFELFIEVLGKFAVISCIIFLIQNIPEKNTLTFVIIILLIWIIIPLLRLMELIFKKRD